MQKQIGRYEVRTQQVGEKIIVYTAWDPTERRLVILKEPLPGLRQDSLFIKSFLEEGRQLQVIKSEQVARCYEIIPPGAIDNDESCYLVLEYIKENLEDKLALGPIDPTAGRVILEDALKGLSAIHLAGGRLWNFRPSSLLITPEGRAKIGNLHAGRTSTGQNTLVMEVMPYTAPEVWSAGNVGPWSDLYSLGWIAYEMFLGSGQFKEELRRVADIFGEDNSLAALYRTWHCDESRSATPLSRLSKKIDSTVSKVVERLMEKNINARYHSADEALRDLTSTASRYEEEQKTGSKTRKIHCPPDIAIPAPSRWQDALTMVAVTVFGAVLAWGIIVLS